ncbi:BQ5605_C017g08386 [Microbotryum silenes-dioicae]|uniref:BQ5605_C017g08386 protein n=1 Tax=Microbotryum silenes-dioicae TaxID=796604 RepID=A0A2X0LYK0_9BASI|nr:BQ5605_C017g08386 [Microbotryum silenes-dioicae]
MRSTWCGPFVRESEDRARSPPPVPGGTIPSLSRPQRRPSDSRCHGRLVPRRPRDIFQSAHCQPPLPHGAPVCLGRTLDPRACHPRDKRPQEVRQRPGTSCVQEEPNATTIGQADLHALGCTRTST